MCNPLWSVGGMHRRSALLTALLLLSVLPITSRAGPIRVSRREPQALSNAQLREGLHVLQATKIMLERADHDYGGHRVAAIRAIGAAEHQLRLALRTQSSRVQPPGKAIGKTQVPGKARARQPEPQALSNFQLADAIVILERTQTLLEHADHDYGGHRAAAVRDLGAAVRQLKVALKYEKKLK